MFNINPSWFIFTFMLALGVALSLRRSRWFLGWLRLEFSLLGFLPLFSLNSAVLESLVKYFIAQAAGSALFLLSFFATTLQYSGSALALLGLRLKLGLFPFYFWVPIVMISLPWFGCFLIGRIQKIPPMVLLCTTIIEINAAILIGLASILIGGIMGVNQTRLRRAIAYSSVSHTGWIVIAGTLSLRLIAGYIVSYFFVLACLFYSFNVTNSHKISNSTRILRISWFLLFVIIGLPPFSVFFLKSLVVNLLLMRGFLYIGFLAMAGAALSAYFYLYILVPSTTTIKDGNNPLVLVSLIRRMFPLLLMAG